MLFTDGMDDTDYSRRTASLIRIIRDIREQPELNDGEDSMPSMSGRHDALLRCDETVRERRFSCGGMPRNGEEIWILRPQMRHQRARLCQVWLHHAVCGHACTL